MASGFVGADLEQLDALAARFASQAAKVREIVRSSTLALMTAEWTGGKVNVVRSEWRQSVRPGLLGLSERLERAAVEIRSQAEQQRQASSAASGRHLPPGFERGAQADPGSHRPGPSSTSDLIDGLKTMTDKDDAFRVQKVRNDAGDYSYIVYISGTDSASDGLMSLEENAPASMGLSTRTRRHLEELMKAHIQDQGAEIMIVGHSQGGMYAEAIAASGQFNVTEVLTVGAPGVPAPSGYGGANLTRLQHYGDWVVNGVEGARNLGLGLMKPFHDVMANGGVANPGSVQTFRRGNIAEGFLGEDSNPLESQAHGRDEGDYNWLADQYDNSIDPAMVSARERQSKFLNGIVVADSDYP